MSKCVLQQKIGPLSERTNRAKQGKDTTAMIANVRKVKDAEKYIQQNLTFRSIYFSTKYIPYFTDFYFPDLLKTIKKQENTCAYIYVHYATIFNIKYNRSRELKFHQTTAFSIHFNAFGKFKTILSYCHILKKYLNIGFGSLKTEAEEY